MAMFNTGLTAVNIFDFRLQHPFSCMVSGPSNSGKTYFVKMLIMYADHVICNKINNIVYIYNCWQPLYDDLLKMRPIHFIQGIPKALDDDVLLPVSKNNLLIIDDVMKDASSNEQVEKAFTQYVHHRNLSVIYLVQNLFFQGKSSRTISLNTNYLILFKNVRDNNQVAILARQMYPGNTKYFMECFKDATEKPHGYLMVDYKTKTPESFRLRTDLLAAHPVVYIQKKG